MAGTPVIEPSPAISRKLELEVELGRAAGLCAASSARFAESRPWHPHRGGSVWASVRFIEVPAFLCSSDPVLGGCGHGCRMLPFPLPASSTHLKWSCPTGRHQEAVGTPRRVGEVPGGGRSAPGKWPSHPCVSNGLSEEEPAPAEAQERWDEEGEKDL